MSQTPFEGDLPLASDVPRIGIVCSYCPEEVIYAAGLQPVRLIGSGQPIRNADSYLHNNLCPYVRSLFDSSLAGDFDECAGMVFVNSCDAMRRLHDVWRQYGRQSFVHILDLLRIDTEDAIAYFAEQLRTLGTALAGHFGTSIDEGRLAVAICEVNENRRLIAKLYELRAANPAQVAGAESFPVLLAGVRSSPAAFQAAFSGHLASLATNVTRKHAGKPRLLITGSVFHHPQIIELAEDAGAVVVAEDVCIGHRHYDGLVSEEGDPFLAVARRYIQRAPCARMKDLRRRQTYLTRLVDEFHVDGVIYHALKFCDLYQYDLPPMQQTIEQAGLPMLYLESDYSTGSYGQMKTRVQAFVEVLT